MKHKKFFLNRYMVKFRFSVKPEIKFYLFRIRQLIVDKLRLPTQWFCQC